MIQDQVKELAELLQSIRSLKVSPSALSDEQMPQILENLQEIKEWIAMVQGEAIHRLSVGGKIKGYEIRSRQYRMIEDIPGAVRALRQYSPEAASACVQEGLANISCIKKVIGKKAFEEVLGSYTVTKSSMIIVKSEKGNNGN